MRVGGEPGAKRRRKSTCCMRKSTRECNATSSRTRTCALAIGLERKMGNSVNSNQRWYRMDIWRKRVELECVTQLTLFARFYCGDDRSKDFPVQLYLNKRSFNQVFEPEILLFEKISIHRSFSIVLIQLLTSYGQNTKHGV